MAKPESEQQGAGQAPTKRSRAQRRKRSREKRKGALSRLMPASKQTTDPGMADPSTPEKAGKVEAPLAEAPDPVGAEEGGNVASKETPTKPHEAGTPQPEREDDQGSTSTGSTPTSQSGQRSQETANGKRPAVEKKVSFIDPDRPKVYESGRNGEGDTGREEPEATPSANPTTETGVQCIGQDNAEVVCHEFLVSVEALGATGVIMFQDWLRVRIGGTWTSRWVLIHNNVMYLYLGVTSSRPSSIVMLDQVELVDQPGLCFALRSRVGRVMHLRADTDAQKRQWRDVLQARGNHCLSSVRGRSGSRQRRSKLVAAAAGPAASGSMFSQALASPTSMVWALLMFVQALLHMSLEAVYFVKYGGVRPFRQPSSAGPAAMAMATAGAVPPAAPR